MIKCVLFDNDGVIVSSSDRFSERLSRENDIPHEDIIPFFKDTFSKRCMIGKADLKQELVDWLPKWKWEGSVDELLHYWFEGEEKINERVKEYILMLKSKGIKCYLVTNQEKYRTDYLMNEMSFRSLFDGVFSSAELGCKKPSLEFYEKVFERVSEELGINKSEVLYIDEEEENINAGKEFGFDVIHFKSEEDLPSL